MSAVSEKTKLGMLLLEKTELGQHLAEMLLKKLNKKIRKQQKERTKVFFHPNIKQWLGRSACSLLTPLPHHLSKRNWLSQHKQNTSLCYCPALQGQSRDCWAHTDDGGWNNLLRDEIGFHFFPRGRELENLFLFILHKQRLNYCLSRDTERGEERRVFFLEQDCGSHPSEAWHAAEFSALVRKNEEK